MILHSLYNKLYNIGKCLLFLGLFVLIGCTTTDNELKSEILHFGEEQATLSNIINSRIQIYNADYENSFFSISLKDSIITIDTRFFPYIYLDDNGFWTVNGEVISDIKQSPLKGDSDFPSLSITSDGYLLVDGLKTRFKWDNTSLNTISSITKWIWAVARKGSYLCFYSSENKNIIPIIDNSNHVIPDYFFDLVVEKERKAEDVIKDILPEEKMSYVFFTDAHWGHNQKHSPAIIKHIVDYDSMNYVLFGGDANTSRTATVQETLNIGYQFHEAFSFLGSKLYCLFGNHDDNSTGQPSLTERHLTGEQVYGFLQSQMTNVHYWDYYNFYFDDPVSKTRFICMDTGRLYESSLRASIVKTAQFLIEVLSVVPDGWHIVAASHIWTTLNSFETGEMKESTFVRPIIEILENYNMHKKSSFSYNGKTIDYDFTHAGAIIEYCIGGHTHCDGVVMSKNGLPLIIVTCDGQQEVAGGAPYQTGTINEQCVTVVVNNYKNREVQILHIGRGNDVTIPMWDNH